MFLKPDLPVKTEIDNVGEGGMHLPTSTEPSQFRSCRKYCQAVSILAILIGSLVLVGWEFGIPTLTRILPGLAYMKPNTAISFVFAGVSLWLLLLQPGELRSPRVHQVNAARIICGMVFVLGTLTFSQYLFGANLGIDELLFPHALAATGRSHPGRMSASTALGFVLLGTSLILIESPNLLRRFSQVSAFLTALNGLIALVGYVYGPSALYQMMPYATTALHTCILFVCLGLGALASRPQFGLMEAVTSERLGGLMARRLIPVVSVLPVLFGWLRWQGELAGHYNTAFGLVIFTLSNVLMLNVLLWVSASWLNRVDGQHRRAIERDLQLVAIVDSAEDAILSKDLAGAIVSWNKGAEKLYGYKASEIIGQSVTVLIPPELREAEKLVLKEISEGRLLSDDEAVRLHKDGTRVHVSMLISPVKDVEGRIVGASTIAHDITERKRSQQQLAMQAEELSQQSAELLRSREVLAEQARMLQSVLDNINDGLIAADAEGKFLLWNPAAERILGKPRPDIPPQEWSQYFCVYLPDKSTPFPAEDLPLAHAIRGEHANAEMFIRQSDSGYGAWIEVAASPLRDDHGVVCGGVAAFRDITQRMLADQEIRRLNAGLELRVAERTAQLEIVNKELESFTYSVSHDLRAPLRQIAGFAKILMEDYGQSLAAEAQRYLEQISKGAHNLSELINEMLNLSRLERQNLQRREISLNSLVEEIVGILHTEAQGRHVEWKIASLATLDCDPVLTRQIFQNLISNALKYSRKREQAVIEIGQTERDGCTVIFVRDNGAGFDMKYADKLFGVFQRLHKNEDFEGIGIGLATVLRIVRKHGGTIWAEAKPDHGATFYFTLAQPQAQKQMAARAGAE